MNKNVIITILVILVLGLGGYLVYDKGINEEETPVNNNKQNNVQDTTNDYKVYSTNLSKKISEYYDEAPTGGIRDTWKILHMGSMHLEFSSSLSFHLKTNGDVYAQLDSSSTYEKNLLSKYGESYKLASEIIDIYLVPSDNAGLSATLYMIKKDGSLKRLYYSLDEGNDYKIEDNYQGLKNIIQVDNHPNLGSSNNIATDINGNTYILY